MEISKVLPNFCKHGSCLKEADWKFTDIEVMTIHDRGGVKEFPKIRTLGYSCEKHRDEVKEMFEDIYNKND